MASSLSWTELKANRSQSPERTAAYEAEVAAVGAVEIPDRDCDCYDCMLDGQCEEA